MRNIVKGQLRKDYSSYVNNIIPDTSNDLTNSHDRPPKPKRFFSFLKALRKDGDTVSPLKSMGRLLTDNTEKADALNQQFCSVFSNDNGAPIPSKPKRNFPKMPTIKINVPGVFTQLKQSNPHKACGPDNISPLVLKTLADLIAPFLTRIIQVLSLIHI